MLIFSDPAQINKFIPLATIFIVALLLAGPLTNKQVEYLWSMGAEKSAILCDTLC